MSSRTTGDVVVAISRDSANEPANLLSQTPNFILDFFFIGKDYVRKLISSSGALPLKLWLMMARATVEDSKG